MVSRFASILLLFVVSNVHSEEQLLQQKSGIVGAGNYTYYNLVYTGFVSLYLRSEEGDADLYVSQFTEKPTFEPNTYCLQSATCDLDVIHIPKSFKRPLHIGVYGHPSREISFYHLDIIFRKKDSDIICLEEESDVGLSEENDFEGLEGVDVEKPEEAPTVFPLLLTFANLLVELLFL